MRIFSPNNPCIGLSICKRRKALQVVEIDGNIMEFKAPILVKELLIKFEGFGIKSSRKSSYLLPPNFELQMGRTYYLFPIKGPDEAKNRASAKVEVEPNTTVKRIKVVITKKQLEELLAKKTSMEKIIFGSGLGDTWKPSLMSIPEENVLSM